jgi:hypothetical protein
VTVEPAATAVDTAVTAVTSVPFALPKIQRQLDTTGMPGVYIYIYIYIYRV